MNQPLGRNVGNALEIKEVISFLLSDETTLFSNEMKDLKDVVFEMAAYMIKMAGCGDDIEDNNDRDECDGESGCDRAVFEFSALKVGPNV